MAKTKKDIPGKRKSRKRLLIYQVFFLCIIAWFAGGSLVSFIQGHFVDIKIVEKNTIVNKYPTTAYFIRDEIALIAPATGQILYKAPVGERVGQNMPVFKVENITGTALQKGESITVNAPIAGVVSYYSDGLESFFRPNELQSFDIAKIHELKVDVIDNGQGSVVEKGKRFCKIVNNLEGVQLYLDFPLDLFEEPLKVNQQITLYFPELGKEINGTIIDLKGVANLAQVLLKLPEIWYSLLNQRTQEVEILVNKKEGIILPRKALVYKNDQEAGVYWLRKGFVFWQPVEIISEDGENLLVEGIEEFTQIVLNPRLVKEGQHVNK